MGSFMLPGMGSPERASCSRVVRFDNECVLIPKTSLSRSKLPVVLTKYSLPLWKRRSQHSSDLDVEDPAGSSTQPLSSEDNNRFTIKVPIPTFRIRSPNSPTQHRSIPSPTIASSLPSCLTRRTSSSDSASSSTKPIPIRRPSLPVYHRRQDELTVPLRDCCADCQRITEQCLKEGNDWKEKFSRGARRRRSASLEYNNKPASPHTHTRNTSVNGTFTPFSTEGSSASISPPSRFGTSAAFSITVDEVDKRRRSFDFSMDDTDHIRSQQSHSSASPFASSSGRSVYPRVKPRDREASSSPTASSVSPVDESLPNPESLDSRNRLRSSPIEEEDETQLFPLPRRRSKTPSPSPPPSPTPNESSSSLPVTTPSSPYLSPTWKSSSSEENIIPTCKKVEHVVCTTTKSWAINATTSTLSSSPPSSLQQLSTMGTPTRRVSKPSDRETTKPFSAIPNTPSLLTPPTNSSLSSSDNSKQPSVTVTNHKPTSPPPPSVFIPTNHTPSSSPNLKPSQRKRKLSFTLPFIKAGEAIREAGVDALRGVSSMSGGGGIAGSV